MNSISWWRHQMETFSALLAMCAGNSPVPGEFPTQRPVTRSFDVFFDLCPNKRFSKQWWGWWSEMPLHPLWRHRMVRALFISQVCFMGLRSPYETCLWCPFQHPIQRLIIKYRSELTRLSIECSQNLDLWQASRQPGYGYACHNSEGLKTLNSDFAPPKLCEISRHDVLSHNETTTWSPFYEHFFHRNSNSMEVHSATIEVVIKYKSFWNVAHDTATVLS